MVATAQAEARQFQLTFGCTRLQQCDLPIVGTFHSLCLRETNPGSHQRDVLKFGILIIERSWRPV